MEPELRPQSHEVAAEAEERRGLERRVFVLEQTMAQLRVTTSITEATVGGIKSTMDSQFKAFERGQELILAHLKPLDDLDKRIQEKLEPIVTQVAALEDVKNKAQGAWLLVFGLVGISGGVLTVIKMLKP